jgi:hypothetical protein
MKTLATLRSLRLSAFLLGTALCVSALATPAPAEACGPYGPRMSPEEREVVDAAQGRLPADGTVYVLSYGKVRIEDDRALVSLELYDGVDERTYWRTFRFVRGEHGWLPTARRNA